MKIELKKNEAGSYLNTTANADVCYVTMMQTVRKAGSAKKSTRVLNIFGTPDEVAGIIEEYLTVGLAGKLAVTECLANAIPSEFSASFSKKKSFEENISNNIKSTPDGVKLTVDGVSILRFVTWDEAGTRTDVRVQHDNTAETKAAYAARPASAEASI